MANDLSTASLLRDGEVAKVFGMSAGWVRKERWSRRHGRKHTLSLDPIMIGRCPRYRLIEVQAWAEQLAAKAREASNG